MSHTALVVGLDPVRRAGSTRAIYGHKPTLKLSLETLDQQRHLGNIEQTIRRTNKIRRWSNVIQLR